MRTRMLLVVAGVGAGLVLAAAASLAVRATQRGPEATPVTLEQLGQYGAVPEFALTERSGRRITREDLRGVVWAVDFIYTECTESCPVQSLEFARLHREFAGADGLRLVSITVDPRHDTPAVLRGYAERYGAGERWWFLTGDQRDIYCLAERGFRLAVVDPSAASPPDCDRTSSFGPARAWASHGSKGLVMHSARAVLVDRAARIRAYHLATERESVERLAANLRTLLAEPAPRLGGAR